MLKEIQEIKPNQGLGLLKFGMDRDEVRDLMGEALEIEQIQDEEEGTIEYWHYDEFELSVGFDEEENWRLVTISVTSNDYLLSGKGLIGLSSEEIQQTMKDFLIEDLTQEEDLIYSETLGLQIWLQDDISEEVSWSPHFLEDLEDS